MGFSRETLVAVTTNIEGREHLRREQINSGCLLENPRAASTDDVECFFSMMRAKLHYQASKIWNAEDHVSICEAYQP